MLIEHICCRKRYNSRHEMLVLLSMHQLWIPSITYTKFVFLEPLLLIPPIHVKICQEDGFLKKTMLRITTKAIYYMIAFPRTETVFKPV